MAISTLGVDHITVPGKILKAMAEDEDVKAFRGPEMDVAGPNAGVAPKANGKGKSLNQRSGSGLMDCKNHILRISWRTRDRRWTRV